jgi:hypothetical protein
MTEEKIGSVNDEKQVVDNEGVSVNLGRHQAQCKVCLSPYREEIEEDWVGWTYPSRIVARYSISRDSLYRHVHALNLFAKRRRNVTMALEKIIERVEFVDVNASAIVSAVKAYAKINSSGQGVEHMQATNPKKLLERMSQQEREAFARDGSLPDWFSNTIGATPSDGQETEKESQVTETERVQ